jgi:Apea-like HEPN
MENDERLPPLELSNLIDEPFVVTFTAHLPFPVGIPNDLGHTIWFDVPFKDDVAKTYFQAGPFVNVRVFEVTESRLPAWKKGTHAAIEEFYGVRLEDDPDERYGEDEFLEHDQWVTLETPYAAIEGEDEAADPAYSFHRCLRTFNIFLQATLLLTKDIRIRTISSHDLRPVVVIGGQPRGQKWRVLTLMYMHPEARPEGLLTTDKPFTQDELNSGLYAILTSRPYTTTMIWRARAQRSLKQTGDAGDAVISFQIAAESLLFDTYRMILVDEGRSSADIASQLGNEIPFKSLLTRMLPAKLGGQWDITHEGTAIGDYWKKRYRVRNSIIHTGSTSPRRSCRRRSGCLLGIARPCGRTPMGQPQFIPTDSACQTRRGPTR